MSCSDIYDHTRWSRRCPHNFVEDNFCTHCEEIVCKCDKGDGSYHVKQKICSE